MFFVKYEFDLKNKIIFKCNKNNRNLSKKCMYFENSNVY